MNPGEGGLAVDLDVDALPFIDEHHVFIAAPAETVWRHLGAAFAPSGRASRLAASFLAAVPRRASGDPVTVGAAVPGFTVRAAIPRERLVLAGRHRFSVYELIFVLADEPGGTRLSARTHAHFPRLRGQLYRTLVIRSGGHQVIVKRMLRHIRRAAEADVPRSA